jgi:hypothetical protein
MKNPPAATTPKPSRATVLPVGTPPLVEAREVTPHVLGNDTSNHPGVSRPNSGRHDILENMTNLQLAEKLAPSDSGAAQTGLTPAFGDVHKTPPPPSNFARPAFMTKKTPPPPSNAVRPAFMATPKTVPSKTPVKTSQPIAASIQVTAEKERVVPFAVMQVSPYPPEQPVLPRDDYTNAVKTPQPIAASIQVTAEKERVVPFAAMQVSPYPPEKPVLPRDDYIHVSAGATASKGKEAGVLANEHDSSESFDKLHEAFISNIRDFGYKEASYNQALLDMNLLLGISHAEILRTQADGLDLTERMEQMSIGIDDFLQDCMKA